MLGEGEVVTKDVSNTDEVALYDTASTDVGDCEVRRGWCVVHDKKANKITRNKKFWTKMNCFNTARER